MKVFLDINVILDLMENREPFVSDAVYIFNRLEGKVDSGFCCALSFPILFYLLRQDHGSGDAVRLLNDLRTVLRVGSVDEAVADRALAADFSDYEDAIQYYAALAAGAEVFITRNLKVYPKNGMMMFSPSEYRAYCEGELL